MSIDMNVYNHDNTAHLVLGIHRLILCITLIAMVFVSKNSILIDLFKGLLKSPHWPSFYFTFFTIDQLALLHVPDRVNSLYRELTIFGRGATAETQTQYLFPGNGERSNLLNIRFANVLSISLQLSCNS